MVDTGEYIIISRSELAEMVLALQKAYHDEQKNFHGYGSGTDCNFDTGVQALASVLKGEIVDLTDKYNYSLHISAW